MKPKRKKALARDWRRDCRIAIHSVEAELLVAKRDLRGSYFADCQESLEAAKMLIDEAQTALDKLWQTSARKDPQI